MPHPCFVYCARLFEIPGDLVNELMAFTGAYDGVIRLWDLYSDGPAAVLLAELHQHDHNVNALALDQHAVKLFSGDAHGVIIIWTRSGADWGVSKRIEDREITGYPVNHLVLHPSGRRLLVHVRDNIVRMLDLRTNAFMQRYHGSTNQRTRVRGTISGCGGFVLAGSEDGTAHMWNTDTGEMVHHFSGLAITTPIHDACFHPHDNLAAFCSFAPGQPILVYRHKKQIHDNLPTALPVSNLSATRLSSTLGATTDLPPLRTPSKLRTSFQLPSMSISASPAPSLRSTMLLSQLDQLQPDDSPLGTPRTSRTSVRPSAVSFLHSPAIPGSTTTDGDDIANLAEVTEQREAYVDKLLNDTAKDLEARRNSTSGKSAKKSRKSVSRRLKELDRPQSYRATHPYSAMRGDELSFEKGDVVEVLAKSSNMWWHAQNSIGETGLVPANFLRKVRTSTAQSNV